jgi:hypothetical protein
MKKNKAFLNMDERSKLIAYKVIAVMYFLTILAMQAVAIYRQFALGQEISDFEYFAIILTVNSLFLIAALLYFGAIPLQKIKIKSVLLLYLLIVVLGSIFVYVKYNIFKDAGLTTFELFNKLKIVFAITGLMVLFFAILSYLGKRRIDKDLD